MTTTRPGVLAAAAGLVLSARLAWTVHAWLVPAVHDAIHVAVAHRNWLLSIAALCGLAALALLAGRVRALALPGVAFASALLWLFLRWLDLSPLRLLAIPHTPLSDLSSRALEALIVTAFALNVMPLAPVERLASHRTARWPVAALLLAGLGVVELLALRPAWAFTARLLGLPRRPWAATALLITCAGTLPILMAKASFEHAHVQPSPEVQVVQESGWTYAMRIDRRSRRLFVTDKMRSIRVFSLDALGRPPVVLHLPTLELQNIDLAHGELYHYERGHNEIVVLDADDFSLLRTANLTAAFDKPEGTPPHKLCGDGKLAHDADTLWIACVNSPLFALDRQTLEVEATLDIGRDSEFITLDPERRAPYVDYWQGKGLLAEIDADTLEVRRTVETAGNAGDIALSPSRDRIYVTNPLRSAISVYDADTLALTGRIDASFGARALGIDDAAGRLIAGSLITGTVDVIDLDQGRTVRRYRVARWLRKITTDPETRRAFVTSLDGLYAVPY